MTDVVIQNTFISVGVRCPLHPVFDGRTPNGGVNVVRRRSAASTATKRRVCVYVCVWAD